MLKDTPVFSSYSVDDLGKAKEFYEETLGLDVKEDKEMQILNLDLKGGEVMVYPKGEGHKAANFTVLNFVVENIEHVVDQLSEKGVELEQYDNEYVKTDEKGISRMPEGPSMAWFKDPAGNILGILQEK